jgi:hypothetical protein
MNRSTKLQACLCLFALLFIGTIPVSAEEFAAASIKTKEVSNTFPAGDSDNLSIDSRYGNVTVVHWNRNEIEIKVVVEAKANTDRRAEELLGHVSIELNKSGNTVYGITSMSRFEGNRNNERLVINYFISKPSKVKPSVKLRYGNVNLPPENDAQTQLEVKYGNVNGGNFSRELDIDCAYGNIDLGNLNEAALELAYCEQVKVGDCKQLNMECRYSKGQAKDVEHLNMEISYGNFNLGSIGEMNIEARYSNFDVKRLEKHLFMEISYGTANVGEVSANLDEIKVEGRYANLNLTMPLNLAFDVIAESMKYGNYNISKGFNVQTTKDGPHYHSKINNGSASRKVHFMGNNYSNLSVKAR